MTSLGTVTRTAFELEYPMSLGFYGDYADAQRAVDYLSDRDFPVQHIAINGTGLKSVERVTGRLTRGKIAAGGALSGLWMGVFVGIAFTLFSAHAHLAYLITTPLLGALFGLIWSQFGFNAMTRRGTRDFSSVSRVVATNYEVVVEHNLAGQARLMLAEMPISTS